MTEQELELLYLKLIEKLKPIYELPRWVIAVDLKIKAEDELQELLFFARKIKQAGIIQYEKENQVIYLSLEENFIKGIV